MPNQHSSPMLGWHPPAELSAWARAEAERRAVPLSVVLTEALEDKRAAERCDICRTRQADRDPSRRH